MLHVPWLYVAFVMNLDPHVLYQIKMEIARTCWLLCPISLILWRSRYMTSVANISPLLLLISIICWLGMSTIQLTFLLRTRRDIHNVYTWLYVRIYKIHATQRSLVRFPYLHSNSEACQTRQHIETSSLLNHSFILWCRYWLSLIIITTWLLQPKVDLYPPNTLDIIYVCIYIYIFIYHEYP